MRMNVTNAETAKETTKEKLVVENVVILDASGSMGTYGGVDDTGLTKYNSAQRGINEEIKALSKDDNATHLYTLVEFSTAIKGKYQSHFKMTPVDKILKFNGVGDGGGTPLYTTMTTVLTELLDDVKKGIKTHKVLVKIFTDGQDTEYWRANQINGLVTLIKECEEKGITVTFMATVDDKAYIENTLKISSENIYAHDNTSRGTSNAFIATTGSTMRYTKSYASGASAQSLNENFFTRTDEDAEKGK